MAKKQSIVIEPQIEDIPFASGRLEEDLVLNSPRKVTPLEIIMEEELPWDVHESTSYIIERKTDTQFLSPETEIILNKKTKPEEGIPELYTLTSGSLSEITSPLEQEMGRYFRLKHLISYDYTNPLYYAINNYPGKDTNYNGEEIAQNLRDLMENCVDLIIDKYPKLTIVSAYRCLELNRMIGGSHDNNTHITGQAIDFRIPEENSSYVFNWCVKNLPEFYELMWAYPERGNKSWIHISYKKANPIRLTTLASEREDIHEAYGGYRRGNKKEYQEGIQEADQNLI